MQSQNLRELQATGQATRILTLTHKLRIAAAALSARAQESFRTIKNVERMPLESLRSLSTNGTALEPAVTALREAGVPVESNVGSLMDALNLTQNAVHQATCYCHENSDTMKGEAAGRLFAELAKRSAT